MEGGSAREGGGRRKEEVAEGSGRGRECGWTIGGDSWRRKVGEGVR